MKRLAPTALALFAATLCTGCGERGAQTPIAPAPRTAQAARPGFDHSAFDEILRAHVKHGMLDYRALKTEHAAALDRYLQSLAAADPQGFANRDDELAYWLNAYNAFVIAGVLEHYPDIRSVMDFPDFFKAKRWKAAGEVRSLDQIENDIIRPRFEDPRIHFILVCAARSCPPLQDRAMDPAKLQSQLDAAARAAVNSANYVREDPGRKVLHLTRIMTWYRKDFVEEAGSLQAYVARYLKPPAKSRLHGSEYSIEFMDYDWALNDAGGAAPR